MASTWGQDADRDNAERVRHRTGWGRGRPGAAAGGASTFRNGGVACCFRGGGERKAAVTFGENVAVSETPIHISRDECSFTRLHWEGIRCP